MESFKELAKKVKVRKGSSEQPTHHEGLLMREDEQWEGGSSETSAGGGATPTGFVAVYAGEERRRFVVPTGYLTHPLFKMLLEKAENEFGFEQRNGLVVPCSVNAFQEVLSAIESCHGKFDFGKMVEEFI